MKTILSQRFYGFDEVSLLVCEESLDTVLYSNQTSSAANAGRTMNDCGLLFQTAGSQKTKSATSSARDALVRPVEPESVAHFVGSIGTGDREKSGEGTFVRLLGSKILDSKL